MANANKIKGTKFETDLVNIFKQAGFADVNRAWGSDGRALGATTQTDLTVSGLRIQAKKGYKQPTLKLYDMLKGADIVVWECADKRKTPYGPFAIMDLNMLIDLLKGGN